MFIITQGYLGSLVVTQGYSSSEVPGTPELMEETIDFGYTDDSYVNYAYEQSEEVFFGRN